MFVREKYKKMVLCWVEKSQRFSDQKLDNSSCLLLYSVVLLRTISIHPLNSQMADSKRYLCSPAMEGDLS
uniref:Uncharacterized protein n=1 Tax=Arundo donax TaxID=35708 RepID=A0A0A9H709_ARUDO